ncbi:MAG: tetratricopeptide repeat protein [Gemmatimonadota bacterium]
MLPFAELGAEEPGVFTEGIHDDLLTKLSNISGLRVISRTAVQQYRGTDQTTAEIAEELGVRWVLEGGVQEMGEEIQVNAQLIDPRSDTHAWAESYRRDLSAENLFDLQSEITQQIAQALETEVNDGEQTRIERVPTEDLEAYRLYVRGRTLMENRDEQGMRRALDYFRRAIEQDSGYALAWSGLSDVRTLMVPYNYGARDTFLPRALEAAERAVALDSELAEAHASLGLVHDVGGEDVEAIGHYRRALALRPSYAQASYWLGLQLQSQGRLEMARPHLLRAVELGPTVPVYRVGLTDWYSKADSLERALEEAWTLQELGGHPAASTKPGQVLSLMERHQEALASLRGAVQRTNSGSLAHTWARLNLAAAHARSGDGGAARELVAEVYSDVGASNLSLGSRRNLAEIYAILEEPDSAFAYLGVPAPDVLLYDRDFTSLHSDPRWSELLREAERRWGLEPGTLGGGRP